MFPTNSECLIGISDAFSAFCLRVSVLFPTSSLYPPTKACLLCATPFIFNVALRPQKRDGLLGTGTEGERDERVKARPRIPPEKDRRDRGPPPEQWKCYGGVPSPLPSDLCTAQLLFQLLCLGRVTKTMSVALLLTNNLDNSKRKKSNFLSPAPPPYS